MTTRLLAVNRPVSVCGDPIRRVSGQVARVVRSRPFFWVLWSFIGCVSLLDAALVLVYAERILEMEENPVCRLLIELDPTGFSYFLPAKLAGTVLVLVLLRLIDRFMRNRAALITAAVAAYQAGLLMYLGT